MSRKMLKTGNMGQSMYDCPVDLDALIMSENCSPKWLELNLNVSEEILYDAIKNSMFGGWLLELDVVSGFSKDFRRRIFKNMDAFGEMEKMYFMIKVVNSGNTSLADEIEDVYVTGSTKGLNVNNLFNPMTMLGNNMKDDDLAVIHGDVDLRKVLLNRIQLFLKTGNKDDIDFSYSLFLPTVLNPRFFIGLSEAEHVSLVGNLDKYFSAIAKFGRSLVFGISSRKEGNKNPARNLIKHIFSDEHQYSSRVKMLAWKQLYKETMSRSSSYGINGLAGLYDMQAASELIDKIKSDVVEKSGHTTQEVIDWIVRADGLFESFELDCTLHNLDATDFFLFLLMSGHKVDMVNGLIEFQDDATRNRLFKQLSSVMVPVKETVDWKLNKTLVNSINNS